MNPRVQEILEVKPFTIKVKWTNGQTRTIDFNYFLREEWDHKHPLFSKLNDARIFNNVKTDGRTLYWENLTTMLDESGRPMPAQLDFCPDVLYQYSQEE